MAKQYGPIAGFVFFVLLGAYMIVSAGRFALDQNAISHKNVFGTFRLPWSEIRQIEVGAADGTLVLHGENKRFVVAPPSMWSGSEKPAAFELLQKRIESTGITPYPSNTAGYKMHKNVRVSYNQV